MPINEKIRADEVMLIDDSGEKLGIVMIEEALDKAKAKNIEPIPKIIVKFGLFFILFRSLTHKKDIVI